MNCAMTFPISSRTTARRAAFTLVEMLVSVTFLVILMMLVTQLVGIVQRGWVRTSSKVSQFREARLAFDLISRSLSQATLNTYSEMRYDSLGQDQTQQDIKSARSYFRQSELQFVSGPTTQLLTGGGGGGGLYPGHAVFFQAPLGVTELTQEAPASGSGGGGGPQTTANTESLVNLLCARGYFVEWGDDTPYRPQFLNTSNVVPVRSRFRLIQYSPSAEMNRIYAPAFRLIDPEDRTKTVAGNSRMWFQDVLDQSKRVQANEGSTPSNIKSAPTRPVAENILALVISPRSETDNGTATYSPTACAPLYLYDSVLETNPGAVPNPVFGSQGTRHLLPPLVQVTMIAMDERSGEFLSRPENNSIRGEISQQIANMFQNASDFPKEIGSTDGKLGTLDQLLLSRRINYRVFTATIAMKQSRWSS